jgi:MFS family permease
VAIADLSSEKVRGASMGFFFTTRMFGFFLGPNISGLMADRWGQGLPFLLGAAGLALGIWASWSLSTELSQRISRAPACPAGTGSREAKEYKGVNV